MGANSMNSSERSPADSQLANGHAQIVAGRRGWRASWDKIRSATRIAQVRLRFLAVFAVAFLVIGNWESLRNYWDHATTFSTAEAPETISNDTEYFCPMCPGVISEWPAKCPVCNMALVRRKKGGPVQLPDGVVSRMQYSPYRLQLAGLRTSAVEYLPLAREFEAPAFLQAGETGAESKTDRGVAHIDAIVQLAHEDAALLKIGLDAEAHCLALPGRGPWPAHIRGIDFASSAKAKPATARVEIDNPNQELSAGIEVSVHFEVPLADVEPFRSQPVDPKPLTATEARQVFICPAHPDVIRDAAGKCPRDGLELVARPLAVNERLQYWCPMHPRVTALEPGHKCDKCNGMVLVPRVITYRPSGKVLAVPESAIIATGNHRIAYIDRDEGMFDGVEVKVGPRVAGYYAVVNGLQAGEKVASAGAFLLDAETRLNPNTSTAYFGATRNTAALPSGDNAKGASKSPP